MADIRPGQRVIATVWGERRVGTVSRIDTDSIAWVLWDGKTRESWMHRDSLETLSR